MKVRSILFIDDFFILIFFKTFFIQSSRIGPEPTTDKFIAVLHGEHDNVIPGKFKSLIDLIIY